MTITITLLVLALGAFGLERKRRAAKREIEREERLRVLELRFNRVRAMVQADFDERFK